MSTAVKCTLGKNGVKYFYKDGKRVPANEVDHCVKCVPKLSCTTGKNGKKYFFEKGKRVPGEKAKGKNVRCKRKKASPESPKQIKYSKKEIEEVEAILTPFAEEIKMIKKKPAHRSPLK